MNVYNGPVFAEVTARDRNGNDVGDVGECHAAQESTENVTGRTGEGIPQRNLQLALA